MANDLSKVKLKTLGTNEPVPVGYACLGDKWPAEGTSGRDRERVRKGIVTGDVDAYRRVRFEGDTRGNIYVKLSDAVAWLDGFDSRSAKVSTIVETQSSTIVDMSSAVAALASIDATLDEIYRVLERLTNAVESIATQPKTAQQDVLAGIGSNGFHN